MRITSNITQKGVRSVIVQGGHTYDPTIYDIDGNVYTSVIIGSQEWIIENFRATKYPDGSAIPLVTADAGWTADAIGAMCYYNNEVANKADYGILYNWHAINEGIAYLYRNGARDTAWRVPTAADWSALKVSIGGASGGGKLKEVGTTHWQTPNTGATDEYDFKALAGGVREGDGLFSSLLQTAWFWTSAENDGTTGWAFGMVYSTANTFDAPVSKNYGCSVRLVRDI